MTKEKFEEIVNDEIVCNLFHVSASDIDDKTGAKIEELVIVEAIARNPELLSIKPLSWFIQTFLS